MTQNSSFESLVVPVALKAVLSGFILLPSGLKVLVPTFSAHLFIPGVLPFDSKALESNSKVVCDKSPKVRDRASNVSDMSYKVDNYSTKAAGRPPKADDMMNIVVGKPSKVSDMSTKVTLVDISLTMDGLPTTL